MDMSTATNLDETEQLEEDIQILNELYERGEDTILPRTGKLVTDPEFDRMWKRLEELDPSSTVLESIAGTVIDVDAPGIKKVILDPPMASIDKAIGKLEDKDKALLKWMKECLDHLNVAHNSDDLETLSKSEYKDGSPVFAMSFKRDGVAGSLDYVDGVLTTAALRPRDGVTAVDVIEHAKLVSGVPAKLPLPIDITIRGEFECLISKFNEINEKMVEDGEDEFANPRNMTAGAMNPAGEPKAVKARQVSFIAHSIENFEGKLPYETAIDRAKWCNQKLRVLFVRVERFRYSKLAEMEALAKTLDYETDGVVVELNNIDDGKSMGRKGNRPNGNPRWKMAWKFAEQTAQVTLEEELEWVTGRTGRCVPVANFDPVKLAGTMVRRCTLHNLGFVLRFKAGVGAIIEIEKSGKIIPKALRTIKPSSQVKYPTHCPSCQSKLEIREGKSKDENGNKIVTQDLICTNSASCPAQNLRTLVNYLSVFGVKGVAKSVVSQAVGAGLVKTFADFYRLTPRTLTKAGLSEREAIVAYARIHMLEAAHKEKDNGKLLVRADKAAAKKKNLPLHQLIPALGIPGASKGTGRDLATHFGTLKAIRGADVTALLNTPNVGESTAKAIYQYFQANTKAMDELEEFVEAVAPKQGKFTGKTFVFTGSPVEGTKEDWMKLVEEQGAKVSSSVSKNTNYVIVGDEAGQKHDKAKELKAKGAPITIIEDLNDLKKLLGIAIGPDDRSF